MKSSFNNDFKNGATKLYNGLHKHITFLETEKARYQKFYNNNLDFITSNGFNDVTIAHLMDMIEKPILIEIEKINQKIQNANEVIKAIDTIVRIYKEDIKYTEFNDYLNSILYEEEEE